MESVALHMIEARGFEVLTILRQEPGPDGEEVTTVVVVCDPLPWTKPRGRHRAVNGVDNYRLATLFEVEQWLRRHWAEFAPNGEDIPQRLDGPLLKPTLTSGQAIALIESLTDRRVGEEIVERAREELEAVQPRWPVVRSLGGGRTSARTDLIRFEGRLAVCRTFKRRRRTALDAAHSCYSLAGTIEAILEPLHVERTSIVIPFLEGYRTARKRRLRNLSVRCIREIVELYAAINECGVALADYGPDNVLLSDTDDSIRVVDFEHACLHPGRPVAFEQTPFVIGRDFFRSLRVVEGGEVKPHHAEPAWVTTYDDWKYGSFLELDELVSNRSDLSLAVRRLPRRMKRRSMNALRKLSSSQVWPLSSRRNGDHNATTLGPK